MDNYPQRLAPEFGSGGGVATPFEEWWPRVRAEFPTVPEEVAREWLHRHWGHSPYRWLRSSCYDFELNDWDSDELIAIRTIWCNFEVGNEKCKEHGSFLIKLDYWPSRYMRENSRLPTPIVVVDNRDGHLGPYCPEERLKQALPNSFILVEGHRRFNLALYLASIGKLEPTVKVWLMRYRGTPIRD